MSNFTDALLLVTLFDDAKSDSKSNIAKFNGWLKAEWPSTQPQFINTELNGVYTASINNAADGSDVVEKFRELNWTEPDSATLMLRKESSDSWDIYKMKKA